MYFCPNWLQSKFDLKKHISYTLLFLCLLLLASCSNNKNTWLSRNVQALTTRYNVNFNGNESYKEGLDAILKGNVDDYSNVLPIYPISNHSSAAAASAQMERALEKAQKSIKEHSIRKKPKKDPKRSRDPKYQAWMKQEEYNSQIDEAWMLQGKAQFHKTDFLAAMGTFTYIIKHFSWQKNTIAEARIWLARSYAEMGWYFEAEDALDKANKEGIPKYLDKDFSAVRADLLLKQGRYREAISYLSLAAEHEKNKPQRTRFNFVLAQLYHLTGNHKQSVAHYSKVIKANPPFEMDFNARVNRAEANGDNLSEATKSLRKMLKNNKYSEQHAKIYYTIGKVYQNKSENKQAIENYKLAINDSIGTNELYKLQALVALADLHYTQSEYIEAQPYYSEAAGAMALENEDYPRVNTRSVVLGKLIQEHEVVILQDSLQELARLPQEEQKAKIDFLIKKLQDDELALKKKMQEEEEAEASRAAMAMNEMGRNTPMGVDNSIGGWYFYNTQLIASGKGDFYRRWGTRKLEDNWRRKNKAALMLDDEEEDYDTELSDNQDNLPSHIESEQDSSMVNTDVNFYLEQLPVSDNDFRQSDKQIADALFNMGIIYQDELDDLPMSIKTFEELARRFPADTRLSDGYYSIYRMATKEKDSTTADYYRMQIIQQYPESTYAKFLSQPDYAERMLRMNAMQDSLYQTSYFAYTKNNFDTVFYNYDKIKTENPLSPLMPKFMFINALSLGKTGDNEGLVRELNTLITEYPQSDVNSMAKDILALVLQGNEVQAGTSHGTMLELRESMVVETEKVDSVLFSSNQRENHLLVIVAPQSVDMNKLQFNVASYNFTGFLVKDFDLETRKYDAQTNLLLISGLDDMQEALWYEEGLSRVPDVNLFFKEGCSSFVISESNFQLIRQGRSIAEYMDFYTGGMEASQQEEQPAVAQEETPAEELAPVTEVVVLEQTEAKRPTVAPPAKAKDTIASPSNTKEEAIIQAGANTSDAQASTQEPLPTAHFIVDKYSPHAYAILVLKGAIDFDSLKIDLDQYNKVNHVMANLQVAKKDMGEQLLITVGLLPDANSARTYLFGILRERRLFRSLQGAEYRNIVISEKNIDELVKTKAYTEYLRFNRETYLK